MAATDDGVWYATREDVKQALDVKGTARNNQQIARALEDASRSVEDLCHRRFYPLQATRYFDWPPREGTTPWVLRLDDSDLIAADQVTTGGRTLTPDEYNLEPANSGPPYTRIEANLGTNGSFGGGPTYQRDVQITGLWGYRNTEAPAGALAATADDHQTSITVDGPASAAVGVGSILRIGSERMLVTERAQVDTGQTVDGEGLTDRANSVLLPVQDGGVFAVGEVVLVDGERLRVDDIAGSQLVVKRGWDGTVLAAHTPGAHVYASRALAVVRGALGTTPSAHTSGTPVAQWQPPGPVRQLVIAEAINSLVSEAAGYARAQRSGEGSSERAVDTSALARRRDATYEACGRKGRVRAV
ncbi:hypothetical protein G3I51_23715 [Streptomyces sp. SID9944]|nr:hypothetical protein [Streptomyces sp. SID9944]